MSPDETGAVRGAGTWVRLGLVALALLACTFTWALSSPPGSSPDEAAHLERAWAVSAGQSPDAPFLDVPKILVDEQCKLPPAIRSGPCHTQTGEIGPERVHVVNRTVLYPPWFHRMLGLFVRSSVNSSVLLMRAAVSVTCVLLMMIPLVLVALVGGGRALRAVGLPLIASVSPLAFFLFASVNPSAWEMAGGVCAWGSFVALVLSRRPLHVVACFGGISVGVLAGLNSRPNGGTLLAASLFLAAPIALARVAPAQERMRRRFWAVVAGCYAVGGAAAAVLVSKGALAVRWTDHPPVDTHSRLWHWVTDALGSGSFLQTAIGNLGWLDTPMPFIVSILFFSLGGYLVLSAIRVGRAAVTLSILMISIASLGVTTAVLATSIPPDIDVQSRYLWPVFIGVLFTASAGLASTRGGEALQEFFGGHVRLVAGGAYTVAMIVAFFTNLRRYTTGLVEFPYSSPLIWRPSVLSVGELLLVFAVAYGSLVYLLTVEALPTFPRLRRSRSERADETDALAEAGPDDVPVRGTAR